MALALQSSSGAASCRTGDRPPGAHEGKCVWLTSPIEQSHDYCRGVANARTLVIANLKGGVGKTTLAANLGAYLAKEWQKRVLLIDLDFSGLIVVNGFSGQGLAARHASKLAGDEAHQRRSRTGRYPAARPRGRS
jgi:Mrp family chromosome partitioning ATPase